MKCEDVREDLEAFALGALDADSARLVDDHLAGCDRCAQTVRAYRVALEHLALAVPLYRAPPRLKQRVLGGVGALRPALVPRILMSRWAQGVAAACLLVLAIGAITWAIMLSSQVERLRNDNARLAELTELDVEQRTALLRLRGDLNSARTEQQRMSTTLEEQATLLVLALDPELIPSDLEGTQLAPSARCSYVWSSKQSVGALTCRDLPSTAFALTYELWALQGEKTVPLGAFVPRSDGSAALLVKFPGETQAPLDNMWVTLEQTGGTRTRPSPEVVLQRAPDNTAIR